MLNKRFMNPAATSKSVLDQLSPDSAAAARFGQNESKILKTQVSMNKQNRLSVKKMRLNINFDQNRTS